MGNYYYTVRNESGKALMSLIMMDSNSYDNENNGYDHFHDNQIQWYENTVKQIAKEENGDKTKVVPSLAFFHIPMQEYMTAYDEAKDTDNLIYGFRFPKEDGTLINIKNDGSFTTQSLIRHRGQSTITVCKEK